MLAHILAATDGSEGGDRALAYAVALARTQNSKLTICTAIDSAATIAANASPFGFDAGSALAAQTAAAWAVLDRAGEAAARAGVSYEKLLLDGSTAETIAVSADAQHADALVIGRHDASGLERLFLGSPASGIQYRCDVPVFVVPPDAAPANAATACILVALDDSAQSDAALAFALRFAQNGTASLVLCSVVDAPAAASALATTLSASTRALLADRAALVAAAHIAYETCAPGGDPAAAIVATAQAHGAGTIVMGTHGRRGLQRMFLGSVAEAVVRAASVPVAVVRALPVPVTAGQDA